MCRGFGFNPLEIGFVASFALSIERCEVGAERIVEGASVHTKLGLHELGKSPPLTEAAEKRDELPYAVFFFEEIDCERRKPIRDDKLLHHASFGKERIEIIERRDRA